MTARSDAKAAAAVKKRPAAAPSRDCTLKKPCFSVGQSRSQIMFRNGLPGKGQNDRAEVPRRSQQN
eukprot:3012376-Lingulodinium_polyedra.AAC.1